jgi:hypothetical protein
MIKALRVAENRVNRDREPCEKPRIGWGDGEVARRVVIRRVVAEAEPDPGGMATYIFITQEGARVFREHHYNPVIGAVWDLFTGGENIPVVFHREIEGVTAFTVYWFKQQSSDEIVPVGWTGPLLVALFDPGAHPARQRMGETLYRFSEDHFLEPGAELLFPPGYDRLKGQWGI